MQHGIMEAIRRWNVINKEILKMATESATSREGEKKLLVKCATCKTGRRDGLGNMNNEPKENSVDERNERG